MTKKIPVYETHIFFGSGMAAASFLTLEPSDSADEPVGYLVEEE